MVQRLLARVFSICSWNPQIARTELRRCSNGALMTAGDLNLDESNGGRDLKAEVSFFSRSHSSLEVPSRSLV